jgi:hypothetical protein
MIFTEHLIERVSFGEKYVKVWFTDGTGDPGSFDWSCKTGELVAAVADVGLSDTVHNRGYPGLRVRIRQDRVLSEITGWFCLRDLGK